MSARWTRSTLVLLAVVASTAAVAPWIAGLCAAASDCPMSPMPMSHCAMAQVDSADCCPAGSGEVAATRSVRTADLPSLELATGMGVPPSAAIDRPGGAIAPHAHGPPLWALHSALLI